MSERPLVSVGDVLDLTERDYMLGYGPFLDGIGTIRIRVKHVPEGAAGWRGDWVSMLAVEVLPGNHDGRDLAMIVHHRALPGYVPPAPEPSSQPAVTRTPPVGEGLHIPLRPMWFCRVDAMPWPCAEARLDLTAGYRGLEISLCCYLATQFQAALTDLHTLNPDTAPEPRALYERFLGWVPVRRNR